MRQPVHHPSALRQRLSGGAADLYDYVTARHPRFEDGFFSRRDACVDDAFRNLLRAVVDDTPMPQRWTLGLWSDQAVVMTASDPEIRRRAWSLLAEESRWRQDWTRRNEQDRYFSIGTWIVSVLVLICVLLWKLI